MPTGLLAVGVFATCCPCNVCHAAQTHQCDTKRNREYKGEDKEGEECVATRWLRVMSATKSIYIPGQRRSAAPDDADYHRPASQVNPFSPHHSSDMIHIFESPSGCTLPLLPQHITITAQKCFHSPYKSTIENTRTEPQLDITHLSPPRSCDVTRDRLLHGIGGSRHIFPENSQPPFFPSQHYTAEISCSREKLSSRPATFIWKKATPFINCDRSIRTATFWDFLFAFA